jgi:hypothetical protein
MFLLLQTDISNLASEVLNKLNFLEVQKLGLTDLQLLLIQTEVFES